MAHVCNKSPACIPWALCSKIQKYYTLWHHEKAATVCHAVSEQGLDGSGLPSSHSNLLLKWLRTWICNFNRTCKMSYEGLVILVIHYVSCCMFSVLNLTLPDSCVPLYIHCFIYSTPVSGTEFLCPPYFILLICALKLHVLCEHPLYQPLRAPMAWANQRHFWGISAWKGALA